jgi:hypothetical protein
MGPATKRQESSPSVACRTIFWIAPHKNSWRLAINLALLAVRVDARWTFTPINIRYYLLWIEIMGDAQRHFSLKPKQSKST